MLYDVTMLIDVIKNKIFERNSEIWVKIITLP